MTHPFRPEVSSNTCGNFPQVNPKSGCGISALATGDADRSPNRRGDHGGRWRFTTDFFHTSEGAGNFPTPSDLLSRLPDRFLHYLLRERDKRDWRDTCLSFSLFSSGGCVTNVTGVTAVAHRSFPLSTSTRLRNLSGHLFCQWLSAPVGLCARHGSPLSFHVRLKERHAGRVW